MHLLFFLSYLCAVAIAEPPDTDSEAETEAEAEAEAEAEETTEGAPSIDIQAEVNAFLGAAATPETAPAPASPAALPNALNPSLTTAADLLTTVIIDDGELNPASTMWLRSLELGISADVEEHSTIDLLRWLSASQVTPLKRGEPPRYSCGPPPRGWRQSTDTHRS